MKRLNFFTWWLASYARDRLSKSTVAVLSVFIHLVIIILVGSVAFFSADEPVPEMIATEGIISVRDLDVPIPPNPTTGTSPKFDAARALPKLAPVSQLSSITTSAPSTFTLPTVDVVAPTKGLIANLKSISRISGLPTGDIQGYSGGKRQTKHGGQCFR